MKAGKILLNGQQEQAESHRKGVANATESGRLENPGSTTRRRRRIKYLKGLEIVGRSYAAQ